MAGSVTPCKFILCGHLQNFCISPAVTYFSVVNMAREVTILLRIFRKLFTMGGKGLAPTPIGHPPKSF